MLQGDVNNLPLSALLQGLDANRNSGILSIESGDLALRLGIDHRGLELLTDSDHGSCPLGEILQTLEILQQEQLSNILANQGNTCLGDALLRFRLLDTEMATGPIRTLFQERILELFRWSDASYRFEVCPWQKERLFTGEAVTPSLRFSIPSLLLEVARREDEEQRFQDGCVHLQEIYLTTGDSESLAAALETTFPLEPLRTKFVRALQESRPLHAAILSSGTPRFLALLSVRVLVECGLLEPMPTAEKNVLVDRLLHQRLTKRALEILRSTFALGDADHSCLEKLHPLLLQEKAPVEERQQLLAALAEARKEAGDHAGTRSALRQRLDLLPSNLAALMSLIEELPRGRSRRETDKLLQRLLDQVEDSQQSLKVAEVIEARRGVDPGKNAHWLESCARLRVQGGDLEGASRWIHSLLREAVKKNREEASVEGILALLKSFDADAHRRWQSRLARRGSIASRSRGVLLAVVLAFGTFLALQNSSPSSAEADEEELPSSPPLSSLLSTPIEPTVPAVSSIQKPGEMERTFSRALRLRTEGRYVEALSAMQQLNTEQLPPPTRKSIEKTREELAHYLESARTLFQRSMELAGAEQHSQALLLQLQLVDEYPHSPLLEGLLLEIPMEVIPPAARIMIDGQPIPVEMNDDGIQVLSLPAANSVLLTAESTGHESQMLWHEPGRHSLLSFKLSRLPDQIISHEEPFRSIISQQGVPLALAVDGQSKIHALSLDDGHLSWELSLQGSGDLLGGALVKNDCFFLTTTTGRLMRIDTKTGVILSETKIDTDGGILRDTPVTVDSMVAVISSRGMVHAFDSETLAPLWKGGFESLRRGALQSSSGNLVITTGHSLIGIDPIDGSTRWETPLTRRPLAFIGTAEAIFVATDLSVERFDGNSGEPLWSLKMEETTTTSLHATDELLIRIAADGSVDRIEPDTGSIEWSIEGTSPLLSTALGEQLLAVGDSEKNLQVFDLATGASLWLHQGNSNCTAALFQESRLVICDEQGALRIFRQSIQRGDLPAVAGPS
ncbi:MAG: PQQ-binding-like beta-propeller repeat protein [Planctomycetota bacterium]|nr:PQQ-binding-like beta-propeller repeat protein [Planctomycetota bacterium]